MIKVKTVVCRLVDKGGTMLKSIKNLKTGFYPNNGKRKTTMEIRKWKMLTSKFNLALHFIPFDTYDENGVLKIGPCL